MAMKCAGCVLVRPLSRETWRREHFFCFSNSLRLKSVFSGAEKASDRGVRWPGGRAMLHAWPLGLRGCIRTVLSGRGRGNFGPVAAAIPHIPPARHHHMDTGSGYEEAVQALNTLQTNAQTLERIRRERGRNAHNSLPQMQAFMDRVGITLDEIDGLSVIHVSGTKGKGSVCAMCESILRAHGYKTGFYSSPHLVQVRERIRINGQPISRDDFSKYFWSCYNKLAQTKDAHSGTMPAYFRFLTIMAFHVFIEEKVDVAVIEVGIGGAYDCTNIVRSPVVCGITSLGLDHLPLLGDTIDKIAWHKAGIIKTGIPAFTVEQPEGAIEVIANQAKEVKAPLHLSPSLDMYDWEGREAKLGLPGDHQRINATLALQLCHTWLQRRAETQEIDSIANGELEATSSSEGASSPANEEDKTDIVPTAQPFAITERFAQGVESCLWPGRSQTLKRGNVTYYLDGAHTQRSVQVCVKWFRETALTEEKTIAGPVARVLLFNVTGDRNPLSLLKLLMPCQFDCAVFSPNIAYLDVGASADQTNYTVTNETQLSRCMVEKTLWEELHQQDAVQSEVPLQTRSPVDNQSGDGLQVDYVEKACCTSNGPIKRVQVGASGSVPSKYYCTDSTIVAGNSREEGRSEEKLDSPKARVFPCISDALSWVQHGKDKELSRSNSTQCHPHSSLDEAVHIQVLITGSLHLIGGALKVLDPSMSD
ncbi:PREDICTED: folylpolyglutamate synthase, mitochondrial-like isoform X2 [Branchiostoma belcheri]|uniref:tetrahydrofolate synthase n=1 Tax=Branchiostoma belcheri TaxID=7741 RepID=A0A6P5AKR0_BRABE|nr:PREDICTED: folylpolyglutamate synthase, mitochondrial-like isoform X2 [Branchiostoma belcheri]